MTRFPPAWSVLPGVLVGVLLLTGCGPQGAELLSLVVDAQEHSNYQAVRVYRCFQAGGEVTLRERITRRADGRFLLELLEWDGDGPSDREDPEFRQRFDLLSRMYRAGLGRQIVLERDFRLRFRELLAQNYDVDEESIDELFLGRHTGVVRLVPRVNRIDRVAWRVRIDRRTGLILEYQQFDPAGGLLASMSFESLDLDPSFEGIEFPRYDAIRHDEVSLSEARDAVPYTLYEPLWLPDGFTLVAVQLIDLPVKGKRHAIVQLTYSDGLVDTVLFESPPLNEDPWGGRGSAGEGPFEVSLFHSGLLGLAEFRIDDTYCHLSSLTGASALRTMVESFAPVR